MTNSRTEVPTVEGVAHTRVPPPLDLTMPDPYDGTLPGAERMTEHPVTDVCRWAIRHRVADCGYPKHPGWTWVGKRWVLNPRPVTAADLSELPAPLAQPEPPLPWEERP